MIADMTNQDPAIVETLAQAYNVNSIPFYIVVPPSGGAIKPPPSQSNWSSHQRFTFLVKNRSAFLLLHNITKAFHPLVLMQFQRILNRQENYPEQYTA